MEGFQCWRQIVDEFKVKTPTLNRFGLTTDEIDAYLPVAMVPMCSKIMPQILISDELISYRQGESNEVGISDSIVAADGLISSDFEEMENTSENLIFSSCGMFKTGRKDTSQTISISSEHKIYSDINSEIDIETNMILPTEDVEPTDSIISSDGMILPETDGILSSELNSDFILQSVS